MTTIMIVEDDQAVQDMLAFALKRAGYEPILSPNGLDALYQATQLVPDLIILDLMMPWASGDAVLGFIRSTSVLKEVPVLVLSAHPKGEELARQLDANAFLAKPADLQAILNSVRQLLTPNT